MQFAAKDGIIMPEGRVNAVLEIKNISKAFGDNQILLGVSLAMEPGKCLGLMGRNGCGKSTLMRIIAQVMAPDGGDILLDGKSVLGDRVFLRKKLGYVPQEDALAEFLTAGQQLKFWQKAVEAENREINELLDIDELGKKRISTLSGGQKKRLSIAMALQASPEYLVMDEAFSALDSEYRDRMTLWLEKSLARGLSVLWCSHDEAELNGLCHKKLILRGGIAEEI